MLETRGVILRSIKYKESSLILDIYTEHKGLQSFLINGVFKKGNQRLAGILQLCNLVDLISYFNEQKHLHRIKEINLNYIYSDLSFNLTKSAIATFILEICKKCLKDQQTNVELFNFIHRCFILLDKQNPIDPNFHLKFLVRFIQFLGVQPTNNYSTKNNSFDLRNGCFVAYDQILIHAIEPELSKLFSSLFNEKDFGSGFTITINYSDRKNLLDLLILYYQFHVEQFGQLKSLEVLRTLF